MFAYTHAHTFEEREVHTHVCIETHARPPARSDEVRTHGGGGGGGAGTCSKVQAPSSSGDFNMQPGPRTPLPGGAL